MVRSEGIRRPAGYYAGSLEPRRSMATQPTQPPPQQPYYGASMPPLPAPTGELVVFLLAWLVVFLVTIIADSVDWPAFVTATTLLAAAFVLSRGIAKAGKVLENR
jgi:hypothetical protein